MAMNGIDIASYQGALDLGNINYDFVMIKATEGTSYVNPYCDTHYQEAKAAGKKRAVYHFTAFGDAIAEANFFVDNCVGYIRDAIFVLDWEGSQVADVGWALRFLQQVEARIGYKPAIYMSEWVENNYDWSPVVSNDNGLIPAKYSDYEIDNNYDMSNAGQSPNVVHWPFYFMWQWTSKGRLNGYAGDLDCDIAFLDADAWDKYAGAQNVTAPTEPSEPEPVPEPTEPESPVPEPTAPTDDTPTEPVSVPPSGTTTDPSVPPVVTPPVVVVTEPNKYAKLKDAVLRAFHTFWQAFSVAFVAGITPLASTVLGVHTFSDLRAAVYAVLIATGGAILSAGKSTWKLHKDNKGKK